MGQVINNEQWKDFFKSHPDLFIEQLYGIKLYPYQKVLLRTIYRRSYASFIERYYTIAEYLKNNKEEESLNKGHRAEHDPYEDGCDLDEEALNEVLKPFIVIKGNNVSVKALGEYARIVNGSTGLKALPIFKDLEVSLVDPELKKIIKL